MTESLRFVAFAFSLVLAIAACRSDGGCTQRDPRPVAVVDAAPHADARTPDAMPPPPVPISPLSGEGFVQFSLSNSGGCGLKADGSLRCWGASVATCAEASIDTPMRAFACPPSGIFNSVVVGGETVCGIQDDNRVLCGTSMDEIDTFYLGVALSLGRICGIKLDGELECSLSGPGNSTPTGAMTGIAVGGMHACAIRLDQSLACWQFGGNAQEVPDGNFTQVVVPTIDYFGACAIRTDGTVACFTNRPDFPPWPAPMPEDTFVQLVAGSEHFCGRRVDGSIACWGKGETHVAPCGPDTGSGNHCGQALPPNGSFLWIGAANNYSCGLKSDGDLECWGHLPWDPCASENTLYACSDR